MVEQRHVGRDQRQIGFAVQDRLRRSERRQVNVGFLYRRFERVQLGLQCFYVFDCSRLNLCDVIIIERRIQASLGFRVPFVFCGIDARP